MLARCVFGVLLLGWIVAWFFGDRSRP